MARVSEIESPGGNRVLEAVFAEQKTIFGELLNPIKVYAHCPPILKGVMELYQSIRASGLLSPQLVGLVFLRVAKINGCPY